MSGSTMSKSITDNKLYINNYYYKKLLVDDKPTLIFMKDVISNNCKYIKEISNKLFKKSLINFAVKAAPYDELLEIVKLSGIGVEVYNEKELNLVKNFNFESIIVDGTFKTDSFLLNSILSKVKLINVDSLLELNNHMIDIKNVTNLIYQDSSKININKISNFDINTPYITLNNEIINRNYINVDSIIPIYLTRGCDWKKCTFCSIPDNELNYKICNIDNVINNIEYLNTQYNIKYFTFIDESSHNHNILFLLSSFIINFINI